MSDIACEHETLKAEMIPGSGYFELKCATCNTEIPPEHDRLRVIK